MRRFGRLVGLEVLRGLGGRRWLAVPVVFALLGWLVSANVRAQFDETAHDAALAGPTRPPVAWDVPIRVTSEAPIFLFFIALGFLFVAGDLYVRDRVGGGAALTLVRARSRTAWWLAKVAATFLLALVYAVTAFGSTLAGSIAGFGGVGSPLVSAGAGYYPASAGMPVLAFLAFVLLYTAVALWVLGLVVIAASTLRPLPYFPITLALGWTILSFLASDSIDKYPVASWINPIYYSIYRIHYPVNSIPGSEMPWAVSGMLLVVTLALAAGLGLWRVRTADM